jgi:5,10-methenyltetrahydromethanopterin hydrogenase
MRAILISVLVLGCGAAQVHPENDLPESIRQFNDGIRWGRFEVAASSIPAAQRAEFVDEMDERANDLKITDYDIVKVDPHGPREAHVQIKISWYKASEGTVHETHALQTWERHGKNWEMVDETRLRGSEMPGLSESVMKD